MSALIDLFGTFCHQMPDRSPACDGITFPLCFRCAGLWFGVLASNIHLAIGGGWRRGFPDIRWAVGAGLLTIPFLVDGWGNTLHLWSSPGWFRMLTGLGNGIALPLFLAVAFHAHAPASRSGMSSPYPPAAIVLPVVIGAGMAWLLMNPVSSTVYPLLAVAALIGMVSLAVQLTVVAYSAARERRRMRFGRRNSSVEVT